ncbi:hypothetical protein F886_00085 [Acinetobacter sp. NIPH 542]|uniref:hypothetical protein n=1 Tax=Acinetobacter sp. NIPH 542 TaxID=1217688 RepID=UPI0002CE89C2|nr:hypothetical protein [Acinetobacter sp. NIPH 542]ENX48284.1 hypothetical protein F886_00085 [Acinetobacter sp. NIPH 542]
MRTPTLESFLDDVKDHVLTINLDQGVFRDITLKRPNSGSFYYNITTRPGHLMISGDMGTFVFKRLEDMFNFFRDENDSYQINTGYWEEKLEAGCKRGGVKEFSSDVAKDILLELLDEHLKGIDSGDYDRDNRDEKEAIEEIENLISLAESDEYDFIAEIRNWDNDSNNVEINDWWEWDFTEYSYHYIWCLYAIVHAIKLYDAVKEPSHG